MVMSKSKSRNSVEMWVLLLIVSQEKIVINEESLTC